MRKRLLERVRSTSTLLASVSILACLVVRPPEASSQVSGSAGSQPEIRVPGDLPLAAERFRSLRGEYIVAEAGSDVADWYGSVDYRDAAGNLHDASHFELVINENVAWSYYVQPDPPYFLGMVSRGRGGEIHIRYTGRHEVFDVSTEDRLREIGGS